MSKKFFIKQYSFEQYNHGGVGYSDIEKILEANNYTTIEFPYHNNNGIKAKLWRFIFLYRTLNSIPAQAEVVFLFPVYARIIQYLIHKLSKRKNIKLVCIIGDIEGLRDNDDELLTKEINTLKKFNNFIVHNKEMALWLNKHIGQKNAAILNLFDFLTDSTHLKREKSTAIVFAGNLNKSAFVQNLQAITLLQSSLVFHLYGPSAIALETSSNIFYHGTFSPYQMPSFIKGSFSLLWEGDKTESLSGSYANYLKINSPHKLSLYILAGIPIITASNTASSEYVKQKNIGVTINNLNDLETAINNISQEAYEKMVENMKPLAQKISKGENLLQALKQL